jgi:hypothetical protein
LIFYKRYIIIYIENKRKGLIKMAKYYKLITGRSSKIGVARATTNPSNAMFYPIDGYPYRVCVEKSNLVPIYYPLKTK